MFTSRRKIVTAVFSLENTAVISINQWLLKTYVSQVLSWRHWSKFCVSLGGFGAMAPAPLKIQYEKQLKLDNNRCLILVRCGLLQITTHWQ